MRDGAGLRRQPLCSCAYARFSPLIKSTISDENLSRKDESLFLMIKDNDGHVYVLK